MKVGDKLMMENFSEMDMEGDGIRYEVLMHDLRA